MLNYPVIGTPGKKGGKAGMVRNKQEGSTKGPARGGLRLLLSPKIARKRPRLRGLRLSNQEQKTIKKHVKKGDRVK